MTETANIRKERIERMLYELRYEIERGMMEREIEEDMTFRFVVPLSRALPHGVVVCEFRTRPRLRSDIGPDDYQPRLRVVQS